MLLEGRHSQHRDYDYDCDCDCECDDLQQDYRGTLEISEIGFWLDRRFSLPSTERAWRTSRVRPRWPRSYVGHDSSPSSSWNYTLGKASSGRRSRRWTGNPRTSIASWRSSSTTKSPTTSNSWPSSTPSVATDTTVGSRRRTRHLRRQHHNNTSSDGSIVFQWLQILTDNVSDFWATYISFEVPIKHLRDHLSLEKTFLSYIRTAATLSMMGVTVAQLLILQHSVEPSHTLGFHLIGMPIACACQVAAIVVTLQGASRFWKQQEAVMRGKVFSGGWGPLCLGISLLTGIVIIFILSVAIDIDKAKLIRAH